MKDKEIESAPRLIFQRRWYDRQWKRWSEWEELGGCNLLKYGGDEPEDWKRSAQTYIKIGATYQYRILERTEKVTWELGYSPEEGEGGS